MANKGSANGEAAAGMFRLRHAWPVLFLAVLLAYVRALNGGMVWDDEAHVTAASLRSLGGLWRIWFELGATQQYYPLLHSAFWFEHALWGDATLGYHLVNVALHATAAGLFGGLLTRLNVRGAWLAALIFALHPVHVESVAWISEQKNTLSACFYLGAALAWLRFEATRARGAYALATGLFVCALLTKTITASLPAALLVITWWRRGRVAWKADVLPLLPWFALGAVAGLFTAWVERTFIGAEGVVFELGVGQRLVLAGRVVWFYLGKCLWPASLTFVYPRWQLSPADWLQWLPLSATVAALAAAWGWRGRSRVPLTVLLLFGGTLFPVLGFLNVYPFRYSFVADHFQYLASLPVIAAAAAGLAALASRTVAWRAVGWAVVAALGVMTLRQAADYRGAEALWRATVARNPTASMAWVHLGVLLGKRGEHDEAVSYYRRAAAMNPADWEAYTNLGGEAVRLGKIDEARALLGRALTLNPASVQANNNMGSALRAAGRAADAIPFFERALKVRADYADARQNLGIALTEAGRPGDALPHYARLLRDKAQEADTHHHMANALRVLGRLPEAITHYETALRLEPGRAETHEDLAIALAAQGRAGEAAAHYEAALKLNPRLASSHVNLGLLLAERGRLPEALAHFEAAAQIAPNLAPAHLHRGAALTALDRWPEAADAFARAVALKPDSADAHRGLGMARANTGRLAEAVTHFETALKLEPNSAETHRNFAHLLRALGRHEEASAAAARAAALERGRP